MYFVLVNTLHSLFIFLQIPLINSRISLADYGSFTLFATLNVVISFAFSMGMHENFLKKHYEFKHDALTQYLWQCLITSCLFGIGAVGIFFILNSIFKFNQSITFLYLVPSIILTIYHILNNYLLNDILASKSKTKYILVQFSRSVPPLIIILVLIALNRLTLTSLLYSVTIFYLLSILIVLWFFNRNYPLSTYLNSTFKKSFFRQALDQLPYSFSSIAFSYTERGVLDFYQKRTELGIFSICSTMCSSVSMLFISMANAIIPIAYETMGSSNDNEKLKIKRHFYIMLLILTIFTLALLILVPYGFLFFDFENEYQLILLVKTLLVSTAFSIATFYLGMFLKFKEMGKSLSKIHFVSLAINLILNFIFVPKYGILGSGAASLFGQVCCFALTIYYLFRIKFFNFQNV